MNIEELRRLFSKHLQGIEDKDKYILQCTDAGLILCDEVHRLQTVIQLNKELVVLWKEPNFYQFYIVMDNLRNALAELEEK